MFFFFFFFINFNLKNVASLILDGLKREIYFYDNQIHNLILSIPFYLPV